MYNTCFEAELKRLKLSFLFCFGEVATHHFCAGHSLNSDTFDLYVSEFMLCDDLHALSQVLRNVPLLLFLVVVEAYNAMVSYFHERFGDISETQQDFMCTLQQILLSQTYPNAIITLRENKAIQVSVFA